MRRRDNNYTYQLWVENPNGESELFSDINTLSEIVDIINQEYFSGFAVITRNMVSNWIHYPARNRRGYCDRFYIQKTTASLPPQTFPQMPIVMVPSQ
tara:strand:+ start:2897 stop:3187 length:291 start_codon:yes stop_codon:yes gene_type:complete